MATPPDFTAGQILTAAQMNQIGLWHLKTTTVTTSTGDTDFVGIFTADYRYYKVFLNTTAVSTTLAIRARLLSASTPESGTNYAWYVKSYVGANEMTGSGETSFMVLQGFNTVPHQGSSFDVLNPQLGTRTLLMGSHIGTTASGGLAVGDYTATHALTTAYDGIRFFPSTGNWSGTISIYGYNTP